MWVLLSLHWGQVSLGSVRAYKQLMVENWTSENLVKFELLVWHDWESLLWQRLSLWHWMFVISMLLILESKCNGIPTSYFITISQHMENMFAVLAHCYMHEIRKVQGVCIDHNHWLFGTPFFFRYWVEKRSWRVSGFTKTFKYVNSRKMSKRMSDSFWKTM